jgi:prophage DNA circulation protein
MTSYQFAVPLPSLVIAHRLYQDASRADQIRAENKVVHPAFCPPLGVALSA